MTLSDYVTQTQRLLHDPGAKYYPVADLQAYVNEGRWQIAAEGQCVRVLLSQGSTGLVTIVSQEVYSFATYSAVLAAAFPGVQSVLGVVSVAISWGSMKPMLRNYVWSDFQAYLRSYSTGLQNYPTVFSQYGQGEGGSLYLWPLPSQSTSMEWDAYCTPINLAADSDPEVIPYPWTDAVQYYAAYKAYQNAQRYEDSDRMFAEYTKYMKRARSMSDSPVVPDFYPSF